MAYTAWSVVAFEQPTAAKWNILGTNDAEFDSRFTSLWGGYILERSVASNNLTVSLKNIFGNDPTSANPVILKIGSQTITITSALSVTLNAGSNYGGAGSSELAAKEVDWFVYIGIRSGTPFIGISRFPDANVYADFSGTTTNQKYLGYSGSAPSSTDSVVVVGRMNLTLSASASFNWSLPATAVIINFRTTKTRKLLWQPTYSAGGSMTYTTVTTDIAEYQIDGNIVKITVNASGTTGGTANNSINFTPPLLPIGTGLFDALGLTVTEDGSSSARSSAYAIWDGSSVFICRKSDASNFGLGAGRAIYSSLDYFI